MASSDLAITTQIRTYNSATNPTNTTIPGHKYSLVRVIPVFNKAFYNLSFYGAPIHGTRKKIDPYCDIK